MFCEVYKKYVDQHCLNKEYIHFSKIVTSFEENNNLPKYLHGKYLIEEEEEFSSESNNVTENEI